MICQGFKRLRWPTAQIYDSGFAAQPEGMISARRVSASASCTPADAAGREARLDIATKSPSSSKSGAAIFYASDVLIALLVFLGYCLGRALAICYDRNISSRAVLPTSRLIEFRRRRPGPHFTSDRRQPGFGCALLATTDGSFDADYAHRRLCFATAVAAPPEITPTFAPFSAPGRALCRRTIR